MRTHMRICTVLFKFFCCIIGVSSSYQETYYTKVLGYRATSEKSPIAIMRRPKVFDCAMACMTEFDCTGYNAKLESNGIMCELITSPIALIANNESWNYYGYYVSKSKVKWPRIE